MTGFTRNLFPDDWACIICDAPQGTCEHSWGRALALDSFSTCRVLEDWSEAIVDRDGHKYDLLMYKAGEDIRPVEARRIALLGAKIGWAPGEEPLSDVLEPPIILTEEEMLGDPNGTGHTPSG